MSALPGTLTSKWAETRRERPSPCHAAGVRTRLPSVHFFAAYETIVLRANAAFAGEANSGVDSTVGLQELVDSMPYRGPLDVSLCGMRVRAAVAKRRARSAHAIAVIPHRGGPEPLHGTSRLPCSWTKEPDPPEEVCLVGFFGDSVGLRCKCAGSPKTGFGRTGLRLRLRRQSAGNEKQGGGRIEACEGACRVGASQSHRSSTQLQKRRWSHIALCCCASSRLGGRGGWVCCRKRIGSRRRLSMTLLGGDVPAMPAGLFALRSCAATAMAASGRDSLRDGDSRPRAALPASGTWRSDCAPSLG